MPPTVQTNGRPEGRARGGAAGAAEKRSELVCRIKYNNTLPDIPFDPKFIVYPFESQRYVQYNPTSLEHNYKFELLTEHDLGVSIDLINPDTYRLDPNAYLDPEDENLLDDESNVAVDAKRSRHQNKNVSWLRRTEYISTEYNRFQQSASKAEARVGYSIKKHMKEEVLYKDRESQIKAIQDTFDHAKQPITQHYSKPGVTAVEILPLFPDFEMWKQPCAQVIFDTDPAQKEKSLTEQNEEMSKAMIRGMVDEHGEQFVAYFLPTSETIEKHKRDLEMGVEYEEGEEYEYLLAGEYNWNVKNKASRGYEENYFFVVKDEGIYYNELETRVRLSKRRKIGAAATRAKSRLVVNHRAMTEQELAAQDARVMMLEPPGEEEDELDNRLMNRAADAMRDNEARGRADDDKDEAASPAGSNASSGSHRSRGRKRRASDDSPARGSDGSENGSPSHRSGRGDESPRGSQQGSPRGSEANSREGSEERHSPQNDDHSEAGSPASQHDRDHDEAGSPASQHEDNVHSDAGSPASRQDDDEVEHEDNEEHSEAGSPASQQYDDEVGQHNDDEENSEAGSPAGSEQHESPPASPAGSGSPPGSPARSRSGSPARSGSGSPARSGSPPGSPARSGSDPGSPAGSGSPPGSPARSGSGSPARSGSGSPARSGSGSPPGSPAGSEDGPSDAEDGSPPSSPE